jgi:hypothetical protein
MKRQPPVNPLGPVLLALAAVLVLGVVYWWFGAGKDALIYAASAFGVFALPLVIILGITGVVIAIRRLFGGRKP